MDVKKRIEKLRGLMKENKIDAYIIPSFDAHQSEYVAEHWKGRQWISGFTGSAGTVVITLDDAGLWTDGRYYIQAEKQLEGSGIRLFKMADLGVPSYTEWLKNTLKEGSTVGFDGSVFSVDLFKGMEKAFKSKNIIIKIEKDLIDEIWEDRPEIPKELVFLHGIKYAGKSRVEKLNKVRVNMSSKGANYYLLTSLDDIAWLLNIRGNDVPINPVVISNILVSESKCYLFVDASKVTHDIRLELETDGIEIKGYNEIHQILNQLTIDDSVIFDANKTSISMYNSINSDAAKLEEPNITTALKAIKNEVEIENLRNCQVSDGLAMVKL